MTRHKEQTSAALRARFTEQTGLVTYATNVWRNAPAVVTEGSPEYVEGVTCFDAALPWFEQNAESLTRTLYLDGAFPGAEWEVVETRDTRMTVTHTPAAQQQPREGVLLCPSCFQWGDMTAAPNVDGFHPDLCSVCWEQEHTARCEQADVEMGRGL